MSPEYPEYLPEYLPGISPRNISPEYLTWRHADIYNVSYQYLTDLYKEWADKIKGVNVQ